MVHNGCDYTIRQRCVIINHLKREQTKHVVDQSLIPKLVKHKMTLLHRLFESWASTVNIVFPIQTDCIWLLIKVYICETENHTSCKFDIMIGRLTDWLTDFKLLYMVHVLLYILYVFINSVERYLLHKLKATVLYRFCDTWTKYVLLSCIVVRFRRIL